MVLFIVSLLCYRLFTVDQTPRLLGVVSGITVLGALISGAVCITAAVFGRLKSARQIKGEHENDAS